MHLIERMLTAEGQSSLVLVAWDHSDRWRCCRRSRRWQSKEIVSMCMCSGTCCLGQELDLVERHKGIQKMRLFAFDCEYMALALAQLEEGALCQGGFEVGVFGEDA